MGLFTPNDKKLLRFASRVMSSYGISSGTIDLEFYDVETSMINLEEEIPFGDESKTFSNYYNIKIPTEIFPIIDKILLFCNDKMETNEHVDYLDYIRLEIEIDSENEIISVTKYWGFPDLGDTFGNEYDLNDDEDLEKIFIDLRAEFPEKKTLQLDYSGGGDSGYIEDNFEDGDKAPSSLEDWCYSVLEAEHGGWEINEGSAGYFLIDLENGTVTMNHTMNENVNKSDTFFEESFKKL